MTAEAAIWLENQNTTMKTLRQLIRALETQTPGNKEKDVLYLLSRFNACGGEDWREYVTGPGNTPLFQNEHFRLVLIYWEGYARSKKHGHPEGGCLLKVLSGRLTEARFDPFEPQRMVGEFHFSRGEVSYIHDALAYHIVENPVAEPAVSLHIYSPGIYTSRIVEPASGKITMAKTG